MLEILHRQLISCSIQVVHYLTLSATDAKTAPNHKNWNTPTLQPLSKLCLRIQVWWLWIMELAWSKVFLLKTVSALTIHLTVSKISLLSTSAKEAISIKTSSLESSGLLPEEIAALFRPFCHRSRIVILKVLMPLLVSIWPKEIQESSYLEDTTFQNMPNLEVPSQTFCGAIWIQAVRNTGKLKYKTSKWVAPHFLDWPLAMTPCTVKAWRLDLERWLLIQVWAMRLFQQLT